MIVGTLTYQPSSLLDVQRLTPWALVNRPDVMMLDADIRQAAALIKLAKASRLEDLKVSSFYSGSEDPDEDGLVGFKVSLPVPIFDRKKGDIKEALARQEAAKITKEFIMLRVEREIEQRIAQLTSLQDIVGFYGQEILETLDQSIQTIQNAYAQGQVSFFEVIQTEERLINFKRSYVESLTDYVNTHAALTTALGGKWPETAPSATAVPSGKTE
jgi:cobalt-zinc-cadmium efflux system outer membrane protein